MTLTGTQIQHGLTDAARQLGYLVVHDPQSQRTEPGFPDLVIAGFGRVFAFECKSAREKLRPATVAPKTGRVLPGQRDWLDAFCLAAGVTAVVVRALPEGEDELSYDEALGLLNEWRMAA
jgi:hypothetical protein